MQTQTSQQNRVGKNVHVQVGNAMYSEFILQNSKRAYIKTSFSRTKKHYTPVEQAMVVQQHANVRIQVHETNKPYRTKITIKELLNPQ